jgi:hypothetical protein
MSFVALAGRKGFLKLDVEGVTGVRGAAVEFEGCVRRACFVGTCKDSKEPEGEENILGIYCCGSGVAGDSDSLDKLGGAVWMLTNVLQYCGARRG